MTTRFASADLAVADPLSQGLHELGLRIGDNTRLGSFLMTADAAPTVVVLAGLILLVLLIAGLRRFRRRQQAGQAVAAAPESEAPASGRPQPGALAMLYDTPTRHEPAVPAAAPEAVMPQPAVPQPVAAARAPEVAAASADEQGVRDSASSRLLVAAVDRLLHRVESQQAQIHALLDELKAQSSALLVQGERLLALEARVAGLPGQAAQVGEQAVPAEPPHLASLDQAIALAAQGLSEEELVSRCGLSAAEARLINLVHGQPASGSVA